MKAEIFPSYHSVQKYMLNGDKSLEVEYSSNFESLLFFMKLKNKKWKNSSDMCHKIKELIYDQEIFEEYLKYSGLTLYELIEFLCIIDSKKIFTTKVVKTLKDRYGKNNSSDDSSRICMERTKKNKRSVRKKRTAAKVRKPKK